MHCFVGQLIFVCDFILQNLNYCLRPYLLRNLRLQFNTACSYPSKLSLSFDRGARKSLSLGISEVEILFMIGRMISSTPAVKVAEELQ